MKKPKKAQKQLKQSKIEVTSINVTIGTKRFSLTLDEAKRLQGALNNALGYFNYTYSNPYYSTGYSNRTTFNNTSTADLIAVDALSTLTSATANSVLTTDGQGGFRAVDITIPDATGYTGEPYVNA